jgi:tRNA G37 N-methylase Trm5
MASFQELLAAYASAAEQYRTLVAAEMLLEDTRPLVKYEAIGRIMGTPNTVTNKPHSASSAEAIVETDAEYWAVLAKKRQAVVDKLHAHASLEAARYRIQEALTVMAAVRGSQS